MPATRSAASPSKAQRQLNQLPLPFKNPVRTYLDRLPRGKDQGASSSKAKGKRPARTILAESEHIDAGPAENGGFTEELKLLIQMLTKENEELEKKNDELTTMLEADGVAQDNVNPAAEQAANGQAVENEGAAAALSTLKELTKCPICGKLMKAPTLLLCTHVFCERCLADTFEKLLQDYRGARPFWTGPMPYWKRKFMELMGDTPITASRRRFLSRNLKKGWALTLGPKYCCPVCTKRVSGLPVLCRQLAAVSDHLAAATNEEQGPVVEAAAPEEEYDEDPEVQELLLIEDVFYEQKVKEMSTKNVWAAYFAGWALPKAPEPVVEDDDFDFSLLL